MTVYVTRLFSFEYMTSQSIFSRKITVEESSKIKL